MSANLDYTTGDRVRLTAAKTGAASDVTWSWSKPAGSSAPASSTATLEWVTGANDAGTYTATATSPTASDSPGAGSITLSRAISITPGNPIPAWRTAVEAAQAAPMSADLFNLCVTLWEDLNTAGFVAQIHSAYCLSKVGNLAAAMVPMWGAALKATNLTAGDYVPARGVRTDSGFKALSSVGPFATLAAMYASQDHAVPDTGTFIGATNCYGASGSGEIMGFYRFGYNQPSSYYVRHSYELSNRVEATYNFDIQKAAWQTVMGNVVSGIHVSPAAADTIRFVEDEFGTLKTVTPMVAPEVGIGCYYDFRYGDSYSAADVIHNRAFFLGTSMLASAQATALAGILKQFCRQLAAIP